MKRTYIVITLLLAASLFAQRNGRLGANNVIQTFYTDHEKEYTSGHGIVLDNNTTIGTAGAGANLTVQPGYGTELIIGANDASLWSPAGNWTYSSGWGHTTGSATALVANFNVVSGTRYELTFTYTQTVAGGGITPSCGGFTCPNSSTANTYTYNFRATATTALTFTPTSGTWVGSITSVSLKTPSNGNVTAFGMTLSDPLLLPMGSATYPALASSKFTNSGINFDATGYLYLNVLGTPAFEATNVNITLIPTAGYIGWRNFATKVFSDAANQLDMRNSTAAQRLNVFNTYTSATNNEYGSFNATATALDISTQHGSAGGSARPVTVTVGGAPAWVFTPGGKFSDAIADTVAGLNITNGAIRDKMAGVNGGFTTANGLFKIRELGGNGWMTQTSADADTVGFGGDGTFGYIKSKNAFEIWVANIKLQWDGTELWANATTNTKDIGAASYKWRTGYFGTSVNVGTLTFKGIQASNFVPAAGDMWFNLAGDGTDSLLVCPTVGTFTFYKLPSRVAGHR